MRFFAERRRERAVGDVVAGHHNSNRVLPLGQPLAYLLGLDSGRARAKFRVPCETVEVVPRIWRESEVLHAVRPWLDDVPRCLRDFGAWSLHAYVTGWALSEEPGGHPLDEARIAELAGFFARLAAVPAEALPPRPEGWPGSGDSAGFLRFLADFTEHRVHRPHRPRFGTLFDALGIPPTVVGDFLGTRPPLTARPFVLLHTDVHRANVIVTPGPAGERLTVLDWELALYGDPLHDLATHVVRMGYDERERKLAVDLWTEAMHRAGHRDLTAGLDRDLGTYRGFEHVQSVFPDVLRAALALPDDAEPRHYTAAATRVCRTLRRAWEDLAYDASPADEPTARQALRDWHTADLENRAPTPPRNGPTGTGHEGPAPAGRRGPARHGRGGDGHGWCPDADRLRGVTLASTPTPRPHPPLPGTTGPARPPEALERPVH
ncbi:phosphotransferase family protein [Streptomyces sp. NPDC091377]|uniref:phosphotransferase family protein n=1 Tax=Streptomyces sp. NPDC091377 TaxID=3365995 RepID=UPI00382E2B44